MERLLVVGCWLLVESGFAFLFVIPAQAGMTNKNSVPPPTTSNQQPATNNQQPTTNNQQPSSLPTIPRSAKVLASPEPEKVHA
ncbi:MAG: hypothetical protein QM769_02870 [Pseudoxanthomonas sp.]